MSEISKLKLPVGWSINILGFTFTKRSDDIHNQSQFGIVVDLNLAFRTRTNDLFIPPDHDIYYTHESSVKNITLNNVKKVLSN